MTHLRCSCGGGWHGWGGWHGQAKRGHVFATTCLVSGYVSAITFAGAATDPKQPATDTEDLGQRLVREATGQSGSGIMDQISFLMSQAAELLDGQYDPGKTTQEVQGQIVAKLDQAIASAQRRRSREGAQASQSSDDERRAPQPAEGDQAGQAAKTGEEGDQTQTVKSTPQDSNLSTRFKETRRGWGRLPSRDRDEILQGIEEQVLDRYRSLIDRYFRALAEDDQTD